MNGSLFRVMTGTRERSRIYRVSLTDRVILAQLEDPIGLAVHHHVADLSQLCKIHGLRYGIAGRPEFRSARNAFIPLVVQFGLFRAAAQVTVDTMSGYLHEQGWQRAPVHLLAALGSRLRPSQAGMGILAVGTKFWMIEQTGTTIRFPCLKSLPGDLWSLELSSLRQEAAVSCKGYLLSLIHI